MKEFFKKALSSLEKYFAVILSVFSLIIAVLALIFSFADIKIQDLQFKPDHFLAVIGAIMSSIGFVLGIYFALLAVKAYGDIKKIEEQAKIIEEQAKIIETHKINIDTHAETIRLKGTEVETLAENAKKTNKSIEDKINKTKELSQKAEEINVSIENRFNTIKALAENAEERKSSIDSILDFHTNNYLINIEYQMAFDDYLMKLFDNKNLQNQGLLKIYTEKKEFLRSTRARMCYKFPNLESNQREKCFTDLGGLGDETDLPDLQKIIESDIEPEKIKALAQEVIKNIKKRLEKEKSSQNKD